MKLGIMQPYFFPYLGHFALISACDKWVVFDITQYTRKSWLTRNRILHPQSGWIYITAPLDDASTSMKIFDARLTSFAALSNNLSGKLSHYRKHAPFYRDVRSLVTDIFSSPTNSLVALNTRALESVCRYLGIPFDYSIASHLQLDLPEIHGAGGWAPAISHQLGAKEYINPIGGRDLFNKDDFERLGISLKFLNFGRFIYETSPYSFQEGLSILDVMMWNEPAKVREAIVDLSSIVHCDHNITDDVNP
jgi:hypothetical protein